jgi:hypothetical protein
MKTALPFSAEAAVATPDQAALAVKTTNATTGGASEKRTERIMLLLLSAAGS